MNILVISDTHGNLHNAIQQINRMTKLDYILHCGDHVRNAESLESIYPQIPIAYVAGNCDFMEYSVPYEKELTLMGKKIFMCHGHQHGVKRSYSTVSDYGLSKAADIILFGHTHVPYLYPTKNLIVMNPGSISSGRNEKKETFGLLEIEENGEMHGTISSFCNY